MARFYPSTDFSCDKGNSIAIIDKVTYTQKILDILSDTTKFNTVEPHKDEVLHFIKIEKRITDIIKKTLEVRKNHTENIQ